MNVDPLSLAVGLTVGLAAGTVFFGGLYLATKSLMRVRRPAILMLTSLVVRFAIVLLAAWLIGTALGPWSLLAYLVGITVARIALVRFARRAPTGTSEEGV